MREKDATLMDFKNKGIPAAKRELGFRVFVGFVFSLSFFVSLTDLGK